MDPQPAVENGRVEGICYDYRTLQSGWFFGGTETVRHLDTSVLVCFPQCFIHLNRCRIFLCLQVENRSRRVTDLPKSSRKAGSLSSCGTDGPISGRALDTVSSLFLCAHSGGSDVSTHWAVVSVLGTRASWVASSQINNDMTQCLKAWNISVSFGLVPCPLPPQPFPPRPHCGLQCQVLWSTLSSLSLPRLATAAVRAELLSAKENPAPGPAPWTPSNRLVLQDLHLELLSHSRVWFSCWCLCLRDAT